MKLFEIVTDVDFLHKQCLEIEKPYSEENKNLLLEMIDYLKNSQDLEISEKYNIRPGVGLAANQIGVQKRMLAIYIVNDDGSETKYGLINPKITSHSVKEAYIESGEGCLSVPVDVPGYVYRHANVTIQSFDVVSNKDIVIKARGYLSIVLQHEIDHLNGILYYEKINKDNPFILKENSIAI